MVNNPYGHAPLPEITDTSYFLKDLQELMDIFIVSTIEVNGYFYTSLAMGSTGAFLSKISV
jgi:hypothetical protein